MCLYTHSDIWLCRPWIGVAESLFPRQPLSPGHEASRPGIESANRGPIGKLAPGNRCKSCFPAVESFDLPICSTSILLASAHPNAGPHGFPPSSKLIRKSASPRNSSTAASESASRTEVFIAYPICGRFTESPAQKTFRCTILSKSKGGCARRSEIIVLPKCRMIRHNSRRAVKEAK